jgi:hypothetical protein
MKKNVLIAIACFALCMKVAAQENSAAAKTLQETEDSMFTGIRPPGGRAYVFSSVQEKEMSVSGKRNNVIEQIKKNQSDPERIKLLRMELWRIDNAIVVEPKTKNK